MDEENSCNQAHNKREYKFFSTNLRLMIQDCVLGRIITLHDAAKRIKTLKGMTLYLLNPLHTFV